MDMKMLDWKLCGEGLVLVIVREVFIGQVGKLYLRPCLTQQSIADASYAGIHPQWLVYHLLMCVLGSLCRHCTCSPGMLFDAPCGAPWVSVPVCKPLLFSAHCLMSSFGNA